MSSRCLKVRRFAGRQRLAVYLLSAPTTCGRCVDRFGAGLDFPGQPGVSPTHAAHGSAVLFGRSRWPSPRRWNRSRVVGLLRSLVDAFPVLENALPLGLAEAVQLLSPDPHDRVCASSGVSGHAWLAVGSDGRWSPRSDHRLGSGIDMVANRPLRSRWRHGVGDDDENALVRHPALAAGEPAAALRSGWGVVELVVVVEA
jgi:hypothetical protein